METIIKTLREVELTEQDVEEALLEHVIEYHEPKITLTDDTEVFYRLHQGKLNGARVRIFYEEAKE